jgi:hypothetical protein
VLSLPPAVRIFVATTPTNMHVGDTSPADIVYDYTATRSRAGPSAFLSPFRGYLQADTYAGYDALYATGQMVEVGCWAHACRYFWDAGNSRLQCTISSHQFSDKMRHLLRMPGWFSISVLR